MVIDTRESKGETAIDVAIKCEVSDVRVINPLMGRK